PRTELILSSARSAPEESELDSPRSLYGRPGRRGGAVVTVGGDPLSVALWARRRFRRSSGSRRESLLRRCEGVGAAAVGAEPVDETEIGAGFAGCARLRRGTGVLRGNARVRRGRRCVGTGTVKALGGRVSAGRERIAAAAG